MIRPLVKSSAGLDVHKKVIVCTILKEAANGEVVRQTKEYETYSIALKELAKWLKDSEVEIAVMESTGVYWKSVYEALEDLEINTYVVNAYHVKNVPGRKTDVQDSEWLAELARCGLLRASFIPPRDIRELRLLTRYRLKLCRILSAEKNRLHKVLESCGIKLGNVVSDIDGVSARKMIEALIEDKKEPYEIAELALAKLCKKKKELQKSLNGNLSNRHRFVLERIQSHVSWLEQQIEEIDSQVFAAMEPYPALTHEHK